MRKEVEGGTLDMGTWIFRLSGLGAENKIYMLGIFFLNCFTLYKNWGGKSCILE